MKATVYFIIGLLTSFLNHTKLSEGDRNIIDNKNQTFRHISIEDGLSQSTVFCIMQDSKGFMWFGTRSGGLNRFDGYKFTVFKHSVEDTTSLSSNEIIALYEDYRNQIWVGTRNGGLNKFSYVTSNFKHINNSEIKNSDKIGKIIKDIVEDNMHRLWILSEKGIGYINPDRSAFIKMQTFARSPAYLAIKILNNKYIYVLSEQNLMKIDLLSFKTVQVDKNDCTDEHNAIHYSAIGIISNHELALGYNHGIIFAHINKQGDIQHTDTMYFESNKIIIRDIQKDRNNNLWIGTKEGLLQIDNQRSTIQRYRKDENNQASLSHNSIYSIYEDKTGILWIGTWGAGVNLLAGEFNNFTHIKHISNSDNTLSNNIVSSFIEDANGIWIGTELGGLNYYNYQKKQFTWFLYDSLKTNSLNNNHVKCLEFDSDSNLWIGTFGSGLTKLNITNKKFTQFLPDKRVFSIYEQQPKKLWIGTMTGLYLFDYKNNKATKIPLPIEQDKQHLSDNTFVTCLYADSRQNLWIGTKINGLICFNPKENTYFTYRYNAKVTGAISSNYIITICEDKQAKLWIGTNNGVNLFNRTNASFTCYNETHGIPDNFINGILSDSHSKLWISTNKGICCFNPDNKKISAFDISDGLQSNEFTRGACYQAESGKMYFGGINGYTCFHPDSIQFNEAIPDIVITDFKVFNKTVRAGEENSPLKKHISETQNIVLHYNQNSFSFEFVAINYISTHKNQYAYYLEGFENTWNYCGTNRIATYTNIKPGQYIFKVKGANNDNIWNRKGAQIHITIKPPYWLTTYALIIYFIFILASLLFIRKLIIFRMEQNNQLNNERIAKKRIEEVNKMKLNFFTNISHEFRTPLTLIASPLEKLIQKENQTEENQYLYRLMHNNVNRLLRLINQLLDFRKAEYEGIKLKVKQGDINQVIKEIIADFKDYAKQKNIELIYKSSIDTLYKDQWFDKEVLEKSIFNLLSNAFKYTPNKGQITITITQTNNQINIKVSDTGTGIPANKIDAIFERFYSSETLESDQYKSTGIGLAFTKYLIELHCGTIKVESTINKGTDFYISIPYKREAFKKEEIIEEKLNNDFLSENIQDIAKVQTALPVDWIKQEFKHTEILLIEDNEQLREYIKHELSGLTIHEAADGSTGIEIAKRIVPDLIISDIMMSGKNGLEVCKTLKSEILTSHVPIILLTARTAMEHKIEGLKTGADAYIEKPFNIHHLKTRIANLLEQRKKLQVYYAKHVLSDSKELPKTDNPEEIFLNSTYQIIDQNINNPEFDVEQLAKALSMSRSQLFRKFKAIVSSTPSEYIREMRLVYAAKILQKADLTIKEVAYKSGFSSPSYFVTAFKKHYGKTPTEYLNSLR